MRWFLLALTVFMAPALAEDTKSVSEPEKPIWTLQKAVCIWVHPEHRKQWGRTLVIFDLPLTEQNIETIKYTLEHDIGRVDLCTEEAS
mgnify:CR=1 FL=1